MLFEKKDTNFFYEFWIGKDINLLKYWNAYYDGKGYEQKFSEMKTAK